MDGTGNAPGIGVGIRLTADFQQGFGIPVSQVFIQKVAIDGSCHHPSPVFGLNDPFPDHPGHGTDGDEVLDGEMQFLQQNQGHDC